MILQRIYRKLFEAFDWLLNKVRILHLQVKNPKLIVKGNCKIGKNCYIVCTDNSNMILDSVVISNQVHIVASNGGNIEISKSFIGSNCHIVSIESIVIKENCEIAEFVVIRDQDHKFNFSDIPVGKQGFVSGAIVIESNVWLGTKSSVLKGVTIGGNSVIGAHALVNKNISKNQIALGVPAKEVNNMNR